MPTYEYRCPKGHDFERFYKTISGSVAEVACPECGEMAGRKLSAGAGLMFKGSGFYLTDYGKNAHRGESPKASGGDGAAKTESPKTGATPKAEGAKPASSKPETPAAKPSKPTSE